jgi:acetyl-CoA acetyltransferase family protein
MIAGGTESMSRAPYVVAKAEVPWSRDLQMYDTTIGWRFTNPRLAAMHHPYSMGQTAENVAREHGITREDQDRFALASHQRWAAAKASCRFEREIVAVSVAQRKGEPILVTTDEHPRPDATLEKLARLEPAFATDGKGTVTAGNSSGINDGAAALLLVEEKTAQRLKLEPLAWVGRSATAGVDPACMGIGPVPATRKVLKRAGLRMEDLDVVELNEAFAAQSLACIRELGLDPQRVNPNGGAIAIGHPLGCSGARLAATLAHELKARGARHGLATLCVGVGQGTATIIEGAGT